MADHVAAFEWDAKVRGRSAVAWRIQHMPWGSTVGHLFTAGHVLEEGEAPGGCRGRNPLATLGGAEKDFRAPQSRQSLPQVKAVL